MSKLLVSFLTIVLAIMLCFTLVRSASGIQEPLSFRETMVRVSDFELDFSNTIDQIKHIRNELARIPEAVPEWGKTEEKADVEDIGEIVSYQIVFENFGIYMRQYNAYGDYVDVPYTLGEIFGLDEDNVVSHFFAYFVQCADYVFVIIDVAFDLVTIVIPLAIDILANFVNILDLLFYFLGFTVSA